MTAYAKRRSRLIRDTKRTADAILVTDETNVRWLTGFTGDSSHLLLGRNVELLLTDSRYTAQIAEECPDVHSVSRDARQPMADLVTHAVRQEGIRKIALEADSLSVSHWRAFEQHLDGTEFVPTSGVVEQLRQVKDAGEIAAIREAIHLAERGFECLRSGLRPDQSERQVAHELEHSMRRFGADRAAFDPIVAVGSNAALPHARPGHRQVSESGVLLVDWGAQARNGYRSDLTRVLLTHRTSPKLRKIYDVVLKAQQAALRAIRPGAKCSRVDRAARNIIDKAGFSRYFGHGLGHGIGLDIHEQPRLSPISDTVLESGMVMTVEPGIYLPGWAGVRIEDNVLVTSDGCEVLTSVPRNFEQAQVHYLMRRT